MSPNGWRILIDRERQAAEQMPADVQLARHGLPALRLFTWSRPAVSLGWKQSPPRWLDSSAFQEAGVAIVERPTGGGIGFHGSDLSWSVTIPHSHTASMHQAVAGICQAAILLCESFGVNASSLLECGRSSPITVCLAEPSPYAIVVGSRKLAGMAIRRFETSWLVQGSMLVRTLPEVFHRLLPEAVTEQLALHAVPFSEAIGELVDETLVATRWAAQWLVMNSSGKEYA